MKSIGTKIMAIMLLISLVGMGTIAGTGIVLLKNSLMKESLDRVAQNTAREAERINGWLEAQKAYMKAFAVESSVRGEISEESLLRVLQTHLEKNPQDFDIYMGFPNGRGVFATDVAPDYAGGWSAATRPWYKAAQEDLGDSAITDPYTDTQTGQLCITISNAVVRNGAIAAVAAADVLIGELADIVEKTNVGEGSYAFMTDANGAILIYPGHAYPPDENDAFQKLQEIEGGRFART